MYHMRERRKMSPALSPCFVHNMILIELGYVPQSHHCNYLSEHALYALTDGGGKHGVQNANIYMYVGRVNVSTTRGSQIWK